MRILLWIVLMTAAFVLKAEVVTIADIQLQGNKHTKRSLIFREILFQKGDTVSLSELPDLLDNSKKRLINLGIFSTVGVNISDLDLNKKEAIIAIDVAEAWYIYPIPIFEWVDRNFNVWWVEQHRSLKRVNYGMEFKHLNLTGRKDPLKLRLKAGYSPQLIVNYTRPYINKAKTIGLDFQLSFEKRKEVNYATENNRLVYLKNNDGFLYRRFSSELAFTYHPKFKMTHRLALAYNIKKVDESIPLEYNPNFFTSGKDEERSFSTSYYFTYENRDIIAYPMKGSFFDFKITKAGLGIFKDRNWLFVAMGYKFYHSFSSRWSAGFETQGKYTVTRTPLPYKDGRGMGFSGRVLHGFEYYVIDGLDMAFLKTFTRYKFFDRTINLGKLMPIKSMRLVPLKLFFKLHNDIGVVNNPFEEATADNLNRKLLWGGGPGIDVVLYYDFVFRFEYSFNHLGDSGLFLHFNAGF